MPYKMQIRTEKNGKIYQKYKEKNRKKERWVGYSLKENKLRLETWD